MGPLNLNLGPGNNPGSYKSLCQGVPLAKRFRNRDKEIRTWD